ARKSVLLHREPFSFSFLADLPFTFPLHNNFASPGLTASRSVEKALEEGAASGALNLTNRKLKEFPRSARNYDLSDLTHADLSKNRLCELPDELCQFISLETLSLYHNGMRSLSSSLANLQALTYLNLRYLHYKTIHLCLLPLLRVLIVSNNKLSTLPASIYALTHLRQLDVSCNELQCLPPELGQNQLTSLPEEISELPLVRLDSISLDNNPLILPPAQICSKGKYHIFKYLNMEACKRSTEELERHLRPTGFNSWYGLGLSRFGKIFIYDFIYDCRRNVVTYYTHRVI
uniref:Leucine-rich repeats and calponin homology (CH) domain containing 4 n=1 Tax=Neogobius melanostomus TaxID=47308 RepID=A0A8C6T8R2_9GOBI